MEQINQRPKVSGLASFQKREVNVFTNYFQVNISSKKDDQLHKYQIRVVPEIPGNSMKLLQDLFQKCKKSLQLIFYSYVQHSWSFYSKTQLKEQQEFPVELDGQEYTIILNLVCQIEPKSQEYYSYIKLCFNSLMKTIRFEQIGRNSFDSKKAIRFQQHKLEIWPGFDFKITQREGGVYLNIEPCHRVIRFETGLDFLNSFRDNCDNKGLDFKREIQREFEGKTVITRYNNKPYCITGICFDKTPRSMFEFNNKQTTYIDYYKEKYNENIYEPNQPLLISQNKRSGQVNYLIPELCRMTGLTPQLLEDFRVMKEIKQVTNADAPLKIKDCLSLFKTMLDNKYCVQKMAELDLNFEEKPLKVQALKLDAGKMVLGNDERNRRIEFNIESSGRDLDRKVQCKMFTQPQIETWGIFYQERDGKLAQDFLFNMEKCVQQFGYPAKNMANFVIKGNNIESWRQVLLQKIDPTKVQVVVLILPGAKGRCQLYNDIKGMLLEEIPVVSQIVLAQTLLRGKNVRSIVSKILIQICAKIGGIPWTVDQMPLLDKPTMICGMDVYHATHLGKKSVLAFCASYNSTATKYWSKTKIQDVGMEASHTLQELIDKAIQNFMKCNNNKKPERLIFFRDGVGDKQLEVISKAEVEQILQALATLELKEIGFMYINVCKRINTRLFAQGELESSYKNPIPGMVVDSTITQKGIKEFYLVSTSSRQGMVKPTRYTIVHDSIKEPSELIEMLTYKLCHTYFNVTGSISVPAPIQYAHKLAALVGDIATKEKEPPNVHKRFDDSQGLYFI